MNITYHTYGEPDSRLRRFVERRASRLDELVSQFNDGTACASLDVAIYYDVRSDDYMTELCFRVGGHQIDVVGEGLQRVHSLHCAFRELTERVDALQSESSARLPVLS